MRTLIAALRSGTAFLFFSVYVFLLLIFSLLTWRRFNQRLSGKMLRFFGRSMLKILGIPLILKNEWPFAEDEPRVVIVNHQSTLDIIWFCAVTPNRLGTVGKREIAWVPVLNVAWWSFRFFYVDRGRREAAIKTMQLAAQNTVLHKRSVTLSPEGTRSADGRMLPFKKGVFHLAIAARLPIYPMVMCGAGEAMPKHTWIAYPHPIHVHFLPKIMTDDWDADRLDEHIAEVRAQMVQAYQELRQDAGLPHLEEISS